MSLAPFFFWFGVFVLALHFFGVVGLGIACIAAAVLLGILDLIEDHK